MKKNRFVYSKTARILALFFSVIFASIFVITTFIMIAKENLFYGEDVSKVSCYQESKGVKNTLNNSLTGVIEIRSIEIAYNSVNKTAPMLELKDYGTGESIKYSIRDFEKENSTDIVYAAYTLIDLRQYVDSTGKTHSIYNDYNYGMMDFRGTTSWVRVSNETYMNLIKKYTTQNRQKLKKLPEGAVVTENVGGDAETEEVVLDSNNGSSLNILDNNKEKTSSAGEEEADESMHSLSTDYSIYNSYDYNYNPKSVVYKNEDKTYDAIINTNFDDNCEIIQSNGKTFLVSYDESVIYSDAMGWVSIKQLESDYFYVPKSYLDFTSETSTEISILFAPTFTSIVPVFFDALDESVYNTIVNMSNARYYPAYYADGVYYCYESTVDGRTITKTNASGELDVDTESYNDCYEEIKNNSDVVLMYDSDAENPLTCYYETKDGTNVKYDYLNKTNLRKLEEVGDGFKLIIGINIDKNTIISDYYWNSLVFSLSRFVSHTVPFFILSFVLFFICIIVMIINTGAYQRPNNKVSFRLYRVDRIPLEIFLFVLAVVMFFVYQFLFNFVIYHDVKDFTNYFRGNKDVNYAILSILVTGAIVGYILVMEMFLSTVRRIKTRHFWDSFLFVRIFRWTKKKLGQLKLRTNRLLWVFLEGILVIATIVLFTMSMILSYKRNTLIFGVSAFLLAVLLGYSFYRTLKNVSGMKTILETTKKISAGELDSKISMEGLDDNCRSLAENINSIGDGLSDAVNISIRDERMKADLITNVSHDIKTPLTSIINYVALIKREKVESEKVNEYVQVLDKKSQRLKQLIEDLVEASKASSGSLTLECVNLNFIELLQQTMGEFDDKFASKNLQLVDNMPNEAVIIYADGRRCFRIVENLFQNAYKYAMPGTRIYLDVTKDDEFCTMKMKNISEAPLNISPEELTERFVRGDESRTTEGSGLGLSIAKDLSRLQNGTFELFIDGDMFTVVVTFPIAKILENKEEDAHNDIE